MRLGLSVLCIGYVLSQFYRAFLAVLTEVLGRDIGATADDLAVASGLWFLAFAAMQIPVGWALDRIGPRRTASVLLFLGGGCGALLFAAATQPAHINVAMMLIGVGCSPVLMASYFIFAREFPPVQFATLAALMLGVGSIGNLVASYPMALATELFGWRLSLVWLACLSIAVAIGIYLTVRDPAPASDAQEGSLLDLLRMPVLWTIFPMMIVAYAPSAAIRGLWMGPYLIDVHGLTTAQVGQATLVMGVAMILGTFAYGPLDRLFGTRKWVVLLGNLVCAASILCLAATVQSSAVLAIALCAALGFFGATFPVIIAHARAFFPPALAGRGVTLMNLFGIGGVGLLQFASGSLHSAVFAASGAVSANAALFALFGLTLLLGCAIYLFSRDATT